MSKAKPFFYNAGEGVVKITLENFIMISLIRDEELDGATFPLRKPYERIKAVMIISLTAIISFLFLQALL